MTSFATKMTPDIRMMKGKGEDRAPDVSPFHLDFTLESAVTFLGLSGRNIGRWVGFNVGLKIRMWAITDGLGFIPKHDPETCPRNFYLPRRGYISGRNGVGFRGKNLKLFSDIP